MRIKNQNITESQHVTFSPDPITNLWIMLAQTKDLIAVARGLELQQYGISRVQSQVLSMLLTENRGLTIDEISNWILRTHQSTLNLINRMEQKGLIEKKKNSGEKKISVTISDEGRKLYEKVDYRSIYMIFSILNEDEQKILYSHLRKLRAEARHLLGLDYRPPFLSP